MAQEALPKQSLYSALLWPSIFLIIGSFFYWILNPTFEMLAIRQADLHPYHQVTFTPNQQDANRDKSKIYLFIVIPAYNEQERLPNMLHETLKFLGTKKYTYEIIVVDDKSTDTTVQVVKDYMLTYEGSFVNLVELKVNRGKGGALKAGVEYTRGDYVLMADADAATDINDLDKLLHAMKDVQKIDPSSNLLLGMTIGSRAHLASKSVQTRTLNVEGWAFDVELIYLCELFHIPIREVDVNWTEMPGSKLIQHKLDVITTSLSMLRDMLAIRFCYATSLWFLPEDLRKEGMDVVEKNKEVAQGKEGVKIESYIPSKKESVEDEF